MVSENCSIKTIALTVSVIIAFVSGCLVFQLQVQIPVESAPIPERILGEIMPGNEILLEFQCLEDGLSRLDIFTATYARKNFGELFFRIEQMSDDALTEVLAFREVIIPLVRIPDNAFTAFLFKPFEQSKDHVFRIILTAPQSVSGNAVTVYQSASRFKVKKLQTGNREVEGSLCFRAMHRRPLHAVVARALLLISEGKPWYIGNRTTHLIVVGFLVVTSLLILYWIISYPVDRK